MRRLRSLATGITVVSVLVALIAIAVIVVGVLVVAQSTFDRLMIQAGTPAAEAQTMFDHGVEAIFLVAVLIAIAISVGLAVVLAARMASPLQRMAWAAERIARGKYDARVPRGGHAELASLADSFNQMARSLSEQERERRDFIANAAHELARPAFEAKDIEVELVIPDGLIARAEPDGLAQVLANVLQNASRYTPRGGHDSIRAEDMHSKVLISITNTGDGIPADDLPHVFERFYRVEKSRDAGRGGAGIGLAIVKQLVEASGGRVGADSNARFTRFWFSLPPHVTDL